MLRSKFNRTRTVGYGASPRPGANPQLSVERFLQDDPGFIRDMFWSDGMVQVFRHWQMDFAPDDAQDDAGAREQLGELLIDAARRRVQTGAGLASFLAGGLDDRLTAALVRRCSETPPASLAIAFEEAPADGRANLHRHTGHFSDTRGTADGDAHGSAVRKRLERRIRTG
jgi:hypothetical protein